MSWQFELIVGLRRRCRGPRWDGSGLLSHRYRHRASCATDPAKRACTTYRNSTNYTNGLMFESPRAVLWVPGRRPRRLCALTRWQNDGTRDGAKASA